MARGLGVVTVMCCWEGIVWEECVTRKYIVATNGGRENWPLEIPVDSTAKEQSGQEYLVGMKNVHKQSIGISHNFSPQTLGWE